MIIPEDDFTGWMNNTEALMLMPERYLLWSLVFARQPKAYLEIGSGFGGSAWIVYDALDRLNSQASMTLIDNEPQILPDIWKIIKDRAALIENDSLIALPAMAAVGQKFDFVLIDGDHTDKGTTLDIEAVTAVLANGAYVLIHDACNAYVSIGIMRAVDKIAIAAARQERSGCFVDCGLISTHIQDGVGEKWAGMHLLVWDGV